MNPPTLPNRLWPFSFHFYRQFLWGCLGLIVFPVLSRGAFASIAYATKRLTDTVLAMHDPAAEAGKLLVPFALFVGLVVARFALDAGAWFSSYNTRSPMLLRIKEEVFAYTQRLSSSYFENTLSGKIAHRAIMLPDQVLLLFDMMVFDFIPSAVFFVFVAAFFYLASPAFFAAAVVAIVIYFSVSLAGRPRVHAARDREQRGEGGGHRPHGRCPHQHPQRVLLRQPAARGRAARAIHRRGARPSPRLLSRRRAPALRPVRDGHHDVGRVRRRRALRLGARPDRRGRFRDDHGAHELAAADRVQPRPADPRVLRPGGLGSREHRHADRARDRHGQARCAARCR